MDTYHTWCGRGGEAVRTGCGCRRGVTGVGSGRAGAGVLLGAVMGCAVFMALFHRVLRVRGAGLCDIVDNFSFWAAPLAFHTFFSQCFIRIIHI